MIEKTSAKYSGQEEDTKKVSAASSAWIEMEKACFQPDETVSGKIHITLGTPSYCVFLTLKGKEKASVIVNKKFKEEKLHIFKEEILLNQLTGHTGYFSLPFTFRLPPVIPNSFAYKGPFCSFSIRYSIRLQADSSRLVKNRIFVFRPRKYPPVIDNGVLALSKQKIWFKENRQEFEINATSKQYHFRDVANFDASCLQPTKTANIQNMKACLFLSMIGNGFFKGIVETVTRCEVGPQSQTEKSQTKGTFKVPLIPLYWEQETEGRLFTSVYSLGVKMADTPFYRSVPISFYLDDHVPNGETITSSNHESKCRPVNIDLELCKEYMNEKEIPSD